MDALKEGLALKTKLLGSDHFDVALSEGHLGYVLGRLGRYAEAIGHAQRAIEVGQKRLGPDHPLVAGELVNEGEILNALARYDDAAKAFLRAKAIFERQLGPEAAGVANALTGLGLSYLGQSRVPDALRVLEHAMDIEVRQNTEPTSRAQTTFALARALWESGRELTRARKLVVQAREIFARAAMEREVGATESWLSSHPST